MTDIINKDSNCEVRIAIFQTHTHMRGSDLGNNCPLEVIKQIFVLKKVLLENSLNNKALKVCILEDTLPR